MPGQNDFKPFAVGAGASVVSQAIYAAAVDLLANGFQNGIADPTYLNKVWRQASVIAGTIGDFIISQVPTLDALDDGTTAQLVANLTTAIQTLAKNVASANVTVNTVGGVTNLTAAQYGASFIFVTGVLAAPATLNFPAQTGRWTVINQTTGAYALTCKTAAGTGVVVRQGGADTVIGDGTNIRFSAIDVVTQAINDASTAAASTAYVDRAVAEVGGYYQDTGGVANAYVVALTPAINAYFNGLSFRFRTSRANTGAATLDAGGGVVALKREDGVALAAGDISVGAIMVVTYDATVGGFLVNELVPSQLGNVARLNYGYGMYVDANGNLSAKGVDFVDNTNAAGYALYPGGTWIVDTSVAAISLALPANPVKGWSLTFIDAKGYWGANNLTLTRNGKNIMGQAADLAVNVSDIEFTIWFNGVDWRLV